MGAPVKPFGSEIRMSLEHLDKSEVELNSWIKTTKNIKSIVKLPGDASTRKYYRVTLKDRSLILMRTDPFQDVGLNLPFLTLQKHLHTCGVDVPDVLDVDPALGLIVLEDLGDSTLLHKLKTVDTADIEYSTYEHVIDSLIKMQINALPKENSPKLDAFNLTFDHEKLMWEINFCIEHFYKGYMNRTFVPSDLSIITNKFSEICQTLANEPVVFTHRDFHSRNIMVHGDRFVFIDFQDARMGPAQYDLASLLKDSYYQLDETQVQKLINYYIVRYETLTSQKIDRDHFLKIFDFMALQRNFKAIGSFASFLNRRGNPGYLKYIGNTFENIRRTLLKHPELSELREVLFYYYYF